jgi:uncharacterized protein (UPF0333 family)
MKGIFKKTLGNILIIKIKGEIKMAYLFVLLLILVFTGGWTKANRRHRF